MDDFIGMGVLECLDHLVNVKHRTLFAESALSLQDFVQFSVWGVVQNNIDSFRVKEKSMHGENVGMFEVTVNFDFSPQLKHNVAVDNLSLGDHLDRNDGFSLTVPRQVHMAIPTIHDKITFLFQDVDRSGSR